jgi:hypothetical protein
MKMKTSTINQLEIERRLKSQVIGYYGSSFKEARQDWLKTNGEPLIGGGHRIANVIEDKTKRSAIFMAANAGSLPIDVWIELLP